MHSTSRVRAPLAGHLIFLGTLVVIEHVVQAERPVEQYFRNVALNAEVFSLAESAGSPAAQAVDGRMGTSWSWGTDVDKAQSIIVLGSLHVLTGVRVYSGIGSRAGHMITRFRLWYSTADPPENTSHPAFFAGGWGMSNAQWLCIPGLQTEAPVGENIAIQDETVLTRRPDSSLVFPPLLVRALKITVDDTVDEYLAGLLNEIEAIAPRHLNPGVDDGIFGRVLLPARGYIWPLYNASDAWHAAQAEDSRCDVQAHVCNGVDTRDAAEERAGKTRAVGTMSHGTAAGDDGNPVPPWTELGEGEAASHHSDPAAPWFSWEGALERNESVVQGTLKTRVAVHNFAVPQEGRLELYAQNRLVAYSEQETWVSVSIAQLNPGLHVFTARLREKLPGGANGEWLPHSERRVVFVGAAPPVLPPLAAYDDDCLYATCTCLLACLLACMWAFVYLCIHVCMYLFILIGASMAAGA